MSPVRTLDAADTSVCATFASPDLKKCRSVFTHNRKGMIDEFARPFDSIESAQEFVALLQDSVAEAVEDVRRKLENSPLEEPRRAEALQLAQYKLGQLSTHLQKSRRILNDLRIIRKLLVNEYSTE